MIADLTGEALEVVDVVLGPHHHLKGGDHLVARSAESSRAKQPAKKYFFLHPATISCLAFTGCIAVRVKIGSYVRS